MDEPKTQAEYEARYHANQRVSGYGIDCIRVHVPCPFCAAPDCIVHGVMEAEEAYARGATCAECLRGWRAVFAKFIGGKSFSFVQTCGPDAPPWIASVIPREEEIVS